MDYIKLIDNNKDEMIEFLKELIKIKSVQDTPFKTKEGEIYPFGKEVQRAYELFMKKAEEFGMNTKNVDNYGGHIDMLEGKLPSDAQRRKPLTMGILGHLDVVPADEGENSDWVSAPFEPEIRQGNLYGRGSLDDKGPMVAALFAAKALKDAGFQSMKNLRLIIGLDEETKWSGMEYYKQNEDMPDFGFSPDAEFPVINGEKGVLVFEIAKKLVKSNGDGIELRNLQGGSAPNAVPDFAKALVRAKDKEAYEHIREKAKDFHEKTGKKIHCKGAGKSLEISTRGVTAHGATPECGQNAISALMAFLAEINFTSDEVNEVVDFYNKYVGYETDGLSLGIKKDDEESGPVTVNVGQVIMDKGAIRLVFNVRYPVFMNDQDIYSKIIPITEEYNMGVVKIRTLKPIYYPENTALVQNLMEVYRDYTGDDKSKPFIIGGGSYARAMDNCVCFGGLFPGEEDIMHQANEHIVIDRLMDMTKIYANAIYKFCSQVNME